MFEGELGIIHPVKRLVWVRTVITHDGKVVEMEGWNKCVESIMAVAVEIRIECQLECALET